MNTSREDTGVRDLSLDDLNDIVWGARKRGTAAPENTSRSSTVSGPVSAAKKYSGDIKRFL